MSEIDKKPKSKRGFACMSPERRREIAALGGKAVSPEKRAFSRRPSLAAKAGRKGGKSVPIENRSFFRFPDLARTAGKKGGHAKKPAPRS
jgi:general stress protein YciG